MSRRLCFAVFLAMLWAVPAQAHPHAWIDLSEEVVFDGQGRVVAIRQHWLFDEFYTAETVQASGRGGKIAALIARLMGNLKDWSYFTRITQEGRNLVAAVPTDYSGRLEGNRLSMTFLLPLAQPVAPPVKFAVYDPTYFIEMLHAETAQPVQLENAPVGCHARVVQPKPDPKAIARAAALDRTQSGGDGLGAIFAETVEVRCDGMP